jgi:membrane fusion protein, heavy metal efflux system
MSSFSTSSSRFLTTSRGRRLIAAFVILAIIAALAWATSVYWVSLLPRGNDMNSAGPAAENEHEHHDHPGHWEQTSIELSQNALKNIGFRPVAVALGSFERSITIPAIVVEQPGRTQIHITAPLTGVVTNIYIVQGQAVEPDSPMFDVRLTHEELVTTQQEYLKTAENLDVVDREIARLESLGEGVIAGKRILDQEYEKQKFEATLRAAEQALLLHGLSEEQVQVILKTRKLLSALTIHAPNHAHTGESCGAEHLFHVQSLPVSLGEQVDAGQELAVLADHCELLVEGLAFEDDANQLRAAVREGWNVTAKLLSGQSGAKTIENLTVLYLADQIDPVSRAFRFYVRLPNKVVLDQQTYDARRFIEWQFKPGQRMELSVPIEHWNERIVLPVDAVVEEAAEAYVYRQNGDRFDRVSVHVEYRDRDSVVVANNGALFPGDVVAGEGAFQMHLALKNKAGGRVDPHAGHSH